MGTCTTAAYWMLMMVTIASVTGKPISTMRTQKRQSDQRVAELETLLALQKYGAHHFLRASGGGGGGGGDGEGSFFPGYGIIDFNKIGRKKKSSPPPSPEEEESEVQQNWVLSPPSSWASPASSVSSKIPSSDMIRIGSTNRASSKFWKAALDPLSTDIGSFDDETDN